MIISPHRLSPQARRHGNCPVSSGRGGNYFTNLRGGVDGHATLMIATRASADVADRASTREGERLDGVNGGLRTRSRYQARPSETIGVIL